MTGDLKALIECPRGVPFQKIQLESAAAARGKRRCLALLRIIVLAAGAVLLALALAALIVHPNFGRFLDLTSRTKPSFWILKGLPPRSPD